MPNARIRSSTGDIDLYYEETGQGFPLIWCHEFGGDYRSYEPQARYFAASPTRRGFAQKDPRGWAEFLHNVLDHSGVGSALMTRGVMLKRKTIFELEPELKALLVPSLIVVGDQDEPCIEPGIFMK